MPRPESCPSRCIVTPPVDGTPAVRRIHPLRARTGFHITEFRAPTTRPNIGTRKWQSWRNCVSEIFRLNKKPKIVAYRKFARIEANERRALRPLQVCGISCRANCRIFNVIGAGCRRRIFNLGTLIWNRLAANRASATAQIEAGTVVRLNSQKVKAELVPECRPDHVPHARQTR